MSILSNSLHHTLGRELHPKSQSHWEKLSKYWLCNRLIKAANEINELQAENKGLKEALEKIIPILGDVDQDNWPVPQQTAQSIARVALENEAK